jgi:hypothetical protein
LHAANRRIQDASDHVICLLDRGAGTMHNQAIAVDSQ